MRLAIAGVILASVLLLWRGFRLPPQPSRVLTAGVGLTGGVMSGLASMGGPPIVVYLMALSHSAMVVRASSIVYFLLASVTLAAGDAMARADRTGDPALVARVGSGACCR